MCMLQLFASMTNLFEFIDLWTVHLKRVSAGFLLTFKLGYLVWLKKRKSGRSGNTNSQLTFKTLFLRKSDHLDLFPSGSSMGIRGEEELLCCWLRSQRYVSEFVCLALIIPSPKDWVMYELHILEVWKNTTAVLPVLFSDCGHSEY